MRSATRTCSAAFVDLPRGDNVDSSLTSELALLEEAKAALERAPMLSLARVAEHRARHPSGELSAECDLIELDALRRLGRRDTARKIARLAGPSTLRHPGLTRADDTRESG